MGKAIVERFLAEGANVVAVDLNAEKLEQLTQEFSGRDGALMTFSGDLSTAEGVKRGADSALGGTIDILINNAGLHDAGISVLDTTDDQWSRTFAINVNAHLATSTRQRSCGPCQTAKVPVSNKQDNMVSRKARSQLEQMRQGALPPGISMGNPHGAHNHDLGSQSSGTGQYL